MISPQDQRIIQIDITNACFHRCSNCTRFCGHHKKPFYMDWETFKKAVASFEGYKGTVGIMGGEPTLHPEFTRFVQYIHDHPYYPKEPNLLVKPTRNFMGVISEMEERATYVKQAHGVIRNCVNGWGLWSALSSKYRDNYELIEDTFNFQALNDHTQTMFHQPLLVRRKDLGIDEEAWYKMRDNCWIQREWSATITPKGAFFCEIAGALDMLFDGPGGWPIEKGWWRRRPEDFGYQLQWCELCGVALDTFSRNANDETDDMSEWYREQLEKLGSQKVKEEGMVNIVRGQNGKVDEECKEHAQRLRQMSYTDSYYARFHNDWLNPQKLTAVCVLSGKNADVANISVSEMLPEGIGRIIFGVDDEEVADAVKAQFAEDERITVVCAKRTGWGHVMNAVLKVVEPEEWILLVQPDAKLSAQCASFLKSYVLNPGTLIYGTNESDMKEDVGDGVLAIFSPRASALAKATFSTISRAEDFVDFHNLWETEKVLPLRKATFCDDHYTVEKGVRYALYGLGIGAEDFFQQCEPGQMVCAADSDCNKWGTEFHGIIVCGPQELWERRGEFDKIYIGSRAVFPIRTDLCRLGFSREQIVTSVNAFA